MTLDFYLEIVRDSESYAYDKERKVYRRFDFLRSTVPEYKPGPTDRYDLTL